MSDGHVICGGSGSVTVTVKVHVAVLLAASVAVQLTGVRPFANALPLGGTHSAFTFQQLSVAVTAKARLLAQLPPAVPTMMSAGQVICGGSGSFTVMVNEQALLWPAVSVATQLTRFVPTANAEPLGGTQSTFTVPQLSAAVAVNTTLLAQLPGAVLTAMSGGQVICGGSGSFTVTVKVQLAALLAASMAVQFTRVAPTAQALPLGGTQSTFAVPHRSLPVTVKITLLKQLPGAVVTLKSAGQVIVGGVVSTTVTVAAQELEAP